MLGLAATVCEHGTDSCFERLQTSEGVGIMIPFFPRKISTTLALCLAALAMGSAGAQSFHESHGRERYVFRGHDVHRFHNDELIRWRGGRWSNSCFGGRCGWWWLAAGQWYFYDNPVYPYPLVVSGIGYVDPAYIDPAPVVITAPPPSVVMPAPLQSAPRSAAPQFWYYCDNPQGYFPSVQTCNKQFRQVPPPPPPQ
jgi:hypothetical protein